ncbi:heat shock protein HspQ [Xanthobacter tagetidis]|nr:heat shock protein HspQ [Xanthobacter tagetidis]
MMQDTEAGTFRTAKFRIGEVVRHKHFPFRGVVFDVDPTFDNTEEWWLAIPEDIRPDKDQPFYHLFAENADSEYVAYVSEQNLERDLSDEPVRHPKVVEALSQDGEGGWRVRSDLLN